MLLIGSRALIKRGIPLKRKPLDYDIIGTLKELNLVLDFIEKKFTVSKAYRKETKVVVFFYRKQQKVILEFEIADTRKSSMDILEIEDAFNKIKIASIESLYLLKLSHRFLKNSPHFLKTMNDIKLIREKTNIIFSDKMLKILKRREKETYKNKLPSLNLNKKDFFKKEESFYVYDHDDIHEAIKLDTIPAYKNFKKDDHEVQCSKEKFDLLPFEIKLNAVIEESLVLALERSQIPYDFKPNKKDSFLKALEKVCTSITSGYFRDFAWENYDKVKDSFNNEEVFSYVEKFQHSLKEGKIGNFKK